MTKKHKNGFRLRLETLERREMLTASVQLVSDFGFRELRLAPNPIVAEVESGTIIVTPIDYGEGPESGLWKVEDNGIRKIETASDFERIVTWGHATFAGEFYFEAVLDKSNGQSELWKTDGTEEGTERVSAGYTQHLSQFVEFNDLLYFSSGNELWATDGTQSGTNRVAEVGTSNLTVFDGVLLFTVRQRNRQAEVWTSDGSSDGTGRVTIIPDINLRLVGGGHADSRQLFFDGGNGIWRSDGTAIGTYLLSERSQARYGSAVVAGNKLYFEGTSDEAGDELWVSDGTVAGTHLVKDINLGSVGCGASSLMPVGNTLFFSAYDESGEPGLWKSDGTEEGTVLVKAINATPMLAVNDVLYFKGIEPNSGAELWKTDGTPEGTTLVVDLNPGSGSSIGRRKVAQVADDYLYYLGSDGVDGLEFWRLPLERTDVGGRLVGDVDNNDIFDSSDLIEAFQAGQYEVGMGDDPVTFEQGDWNGDGVFSSSDLIAAFQQGFYKR